MKNRNFGTVAHVDSKKQFMLVNIPGYPKPFPCKNSLAGTFVVGQEVEVAPARVALTDPITTETFMATGFVHARALHDSTYFFAYLNGTDFFTEECQVSADCPNGWKFAEGRHKDNQIVVYERGGNATLHDGHGTKDWQIAVAVFQKFEDVRLPKNKMDCHVELLLPDYGWVQANFGQISTGWKEDLVLRAKRGWS